MNVNLESLRAEIENYLAANDLAIFRSHPRLPSTGVGAVIWDADQYPDFRDFVQTAVATGATLVSMHAATFSDIDIEDLTEQLTQVDLDSAERHQIEDRLKELDTYTGFVCQIELSFDHGGRTYLLEIATDWYEEFQDLADHIDESMQEADQRAPLSGYYSSNN